MCKELHAIGVEIQELPDGFRISGGRRLKGGVRVNSHGDHRLAMALCVAGLVAEDPIVVEDADVITQSFPGFPDCLEALGAKVAACV